MSILEVMSTKIDKNNNQLRFLNVTEKQKAKLAQRLLLFHIENVQKLQKAQFWCTLKLVNDSFHLNLLNKVTLIFPTKLGF